MKKIKSYYMPVIAGLIGFASLNACKKFIDIAPPKTQAELSTVFSSDQTATSAAVGLYDQLVASNLTYLNGAVTIYSGLSADEISNVSTNSDYDAYRNNALISGTSSVNSKFWSVAYKYIYQANAVMEGLAGSTEITQSVKDQIQGEMLFIRALNYFYLVNLFGDVPYITSTDYLVNSTIPPAPSSTVYTQMTADLLQAKSLLSNSAQSSTNTRPNKAAVTALLARIYLYQKDWVDAEAQSTEIIASGTYKLEPILNNVFITTSGESIFQLMKPTSNTAEGAGFIPASTTVKPVFAITTSLLNSFQSGDNRKTSWLKSNTVSGQTYNYPYKYKVRSSTTVTEYYVVLRFAEQYLIRAEARAEQNNLTGAQADVNMIRSRAGLTNTTATTISGMLSAIASERQIELFAEWGHRWLDLKRTGMADPVLSVVKGSNWQTTDALYPVPLAQIQLNPFLTQNAGY